MRRTQLPSVIAAGALVIALVLLVLSTAPPSQNDDPSSRVAGKAGTLALYTWLGSLGFNVHRVSGQFDVSSADVLLIIDPRTAISDSEAASVMQSVGRGSDALLAVAPGHEADVAALLNRLRISMDMARPAGDSVPAQPFDAADRTRHVPMAAGDAIEPAPYLTPLLSQGGMLTAVAEQVSGSGRVYVLASPFPLSNDGLRDGDSATLLLSLLERARGGAIAVDEVHHGEVSSAPSGAAAVLVSPLGLALLLGVATALAYLALSGRRLGRAVPAKDPSLVPTTAAYIDAMAGLYARSRDRGAVASRYADELTQRLGAGGATRPGDDAAFVAAVASARRDLEDDTARVLQRARALATSRPDAAALLALARDVDDIERRWAQPVASSPAQWRA